jgi:hypothetical protein
LYPSIVALYKRSLSADVIHKWKVKSESEIQSPNSPSLSLSVFSLCAFEQSRELDF